MASIASSAEADLTQVIPLLVDGIAQEIGADRRDMRVTFVADHRQQDMTAWKELKENIMEGTKFVWKRPNDLNHPRPYFEISLDNESLLMQPINTTSECVPKDIKGSQAYTEPGQPAALWQAGSYGSALSTLRTKLLAAMEGNFTTKAAPRLISVAQFQQGTHVNRMTPSGWTGSPIALEAFLHLHTWHARYPKDSGNKYCLELNTPSAGVYGIAFELHTVLQHKWKYDGDWLKMMKNFDLLTHYQKRQLCEQALHSLGYDPNKIPIKADPDYGHVQLDSSGAADEEDYDAQINAMIDGKVPPSFGQSASGASSSTGGGGYTADMPSAVPSAKAMPRPSSSTTRPCPNSQGGQANKMRKIQDVMKNSFPLAPTPSTNRYREMPPISQQACRKACEAIDHGMGQGYSLEDWYQWYLSEELTSDVMDNLLMAWFPDHDIIRTVKELASDFPFSPENAIVKVATPDMALNPLYDPNAVPSEAPPCSSSDQSDPWYVPGSMNFQPNLVVRKDIVFGYHSITPNEVWNFFANGNTRLEPVQNNYFGSSVPLIRMPAFWSQTMTPEQFHTGICGITAKKISLDGWKNRHDLPWEYPLKPHALDCDSTPVGPAGQQVFMHYVIWGLKHLLAETDYYRDFLVWDDVHRSWRLPFAFLPSTDVSPPVFFSCTWRKTDQGWKTSATPSYSNLIRDVRNRRPDQEILHIQLHASDLAMLPFHTRLIWLIPFPAEWHWLPTWSPGEHPSSYVNSELWKKHTNANAQSSSSSVPVVGSMSSSSTSAQSMPTSRPTPSCAPTMATVAEQNTEPEVTLPTSAIPQSEEVPVPQAFPYITHTVPSDSDDGPEIARTPFGSTLVQHVCRDMNDVEANEAVVNKTWFRQLADAEAPRLSSKMKGQGVSTRVHMTRPQWVQQRLQQGEAARWSSKQNDVMDSGSSSHALPPDEVQLPLHAVLRPSMEQLETFLADEAKEMEILAAQHLLTMSQTKPSSDKESETSSQEEERMRLELEYEQALQDREAEEEDQDEDYWKQYYEQLL